MIQKPQFLYKLKNLRVQEHSSSRTIKIKTTGFRVTSKLLNTTRSQDQDKFQVQNQDQDKVQVSDHDQVQVQDKLKIKLKTALIISKRQIQRNHR